MTVPQLRDAARRIWEAALLRADVGVRLRQTVRLENDVLTIAGRSFELQGRLLVIGAGKAAARMAAITQSILGSRLDRGLVVTKYGHGLAIDHSIRVVEAGHPIPDAAGRDAAARTLRLVSGLSPRDVVLCLISGGGSALWPAPAEGITLAEKQQVTGVLMRAGAGIRELNAVRKHLSTIKGGQLARWAAPARMISLIVSDVIDDPLDFIASGPTAPDTTSFADALEIVRKYGVEVPAAVSGRLEAGARQRIADTPKPGDPLFDNVFNLIIANNQLLVEAARQQAEELGFNTLVLATGVEGEARDIGRMFAAIAQEAARSGQPVNPPACMIAAGETTVTVRGAGSGGRNQEMALAWGMAMADQPPDLAACFASIATDGSDGPTDAAGGLVDASTCSRARALGLDPARHLQSNDSYNFLKATGDLVVTGPTLTNLMDLQLVLVG
jgi:hydroxypyruvate reductase